MRGIWCELKPSDLLFWAFHAIKYCSDQALRKMSLFSITKTLPMALVIESIRLAVCQGRTRSAAVSKALDVSRLICF